jgi:hypothetical protein
LEDWKSPPVSAKNAEAGAFFVEMNYYFAYAGIF